MTFPRASGILLHSTSLPSPFGIGDFGVEAYKFVDFLEYANQTYWQILPLVPTGYGDSPYQGYSAFAGNTNLISPFALLKEELLTEPEIYNESDFSLDRVDFGRVIRWKDNLLKKAFERFSQINDASLNKDFETFSQANFFWLDDYALFRAVKISQNNHPWYEWETSLKLRDENALNKARKNLESEIEAQKFYQFSFFRQWNKLKKYANEKGVKIIGDVPIFVSLNSADVWCNPQEFKLNKDGSPRVVSGVPPDYFSRTGQLWGNPIYDWERMQADDFSWWTKRIKFTLETVDVLRIDHFRGFAGCWEVPGKDKTAENGKWVDAPGEKLFTALENALSRLPVMAEDLGVITPDVEKLRDDFQFPGMRIMQYAFGSDVKNNYLPHNFIKNCVVYTGTHDNDTTVGWFKNASESEREFCLHYLKSDAREIHWDFIRALFASVADTVIIPMQDVLGLGNEARMNLPATDSGNWNWRSREEYFSQSIAERLSDLTRIYGRNNKTSK